MTSPAANSFLREIVRKELIKGTLIPGFNLALSLPGGLRLQFEALSIIITERKLIEGVIVLIG